MKPVAIVVGVCGVVMAAVWVNGRPLEKGDRQLDGLGTLRVYRLDVGRPFDVLRKHLPDAMVNRPGSLVGDDALDGIAVARICRGSKCVEMEIELLTGDMIGSNKYSVDFSGTPATLEDTYSLALRLCDVAGIPNDRMVRWYKEKKYENVLTRTQLQTGGEGERRHEIEVRSSLASDPKKPWRVMYTIYFPRPKERSVTRTPEKRPKPSRETAGAPPPTPAYTLDVQRPFGFLRAHLPSVLDKPQDRLFGEDAVDGLATVNVRRGRV